jgi:hypothetical protein
MAPKKSSVRPYVAEMKGMSASEYERLVNSVATQLSSSTGFEADKPGMLNKIQGKSGIRHQIDVSLRAKTKGVLWLIECKYWKTKVDLITALAFHARLMDIERITQENVIGSLITTVGFTKPAHKYATAYGFDSGWVKNEAEFVMRFKVGNVNYLGIGDRVSL